MVQEVRQGSTGTPMKPCIHCGGEGKAFKRQIHAIMANRMPYYSTTFIVFCAACKCRTRSHDTEALIVSQPVV
jgi:hypothetical protein